MKNIRLVYILLLSICLGSCDAFLEEKSQNKIIPTKVEHLKEFLLGEVIQKKSDPTEYLRYMTDDIENSCPKFFDTYRTIDFYGYYTWQAKPEINQEMDINNDEGWSTYYHDIFICNIILDQIDEMTGYEADKQKLKAETYFMRANAYFILVNLYGEPYDKATAENLLGVPINNETGILDKRYTRSSVKKVYDKIDEDLKASIEIFEELNANDYNIARPNLDAAYLLKSRIALYKKEYADVVDAVDKLLNRTTKRVWDLNTYTKGYFISDMNPELLFCFGKGSNGLRKPSGSSSVFSPSQELIHLYTSEDLRYTSFTPPKMSTPFAKFDRYNCYGKVFRMAEAYLNKAEALAHGEGEKWKEAITVLNNSLRINRFTKGTKYELTAASKEEAINLIKTERRIELCYEEHRWFDLRRYGMPELIHKFGPKDGEVEYVLDAKSKSYTLPIPEAIIEKNNLIEQINRKEQPKQ